MMQEINVAGTTTWYRNTSYIAAAANNTSASASYGWQPVLELID
jgi:hypothetical protein